MSRLFNYADAEAARIYDRHRYPVGADIIAGLLHVHCGKQLKDLHVLDAGCGTGQYTKSLLDLGLGKFTLVDASSEMLHVAKEKLKRYIDDNTVDDVVQAQLPSLPFENKTYDAVLFLSVLHHLDKVDYSKTIQAAKRLLRPKGTILMTTVLPRTFSESVWFTQIHPTFAGILSNAFMTTKQHLNLFAEHGFQCVAAINLLHGATPPRYVSYYDHEGPLKEEWRRATNVFEMVDSCLEKEIKRKFFDLKRTGSLEQFMNDHDHTDETGFITLFAFKLA